MTLTIRLADLAKVTGRTRESIRNITKSGHTPWNERAFGETGQRRYDASHALALVVLEMLHEQGLSLRDASEVVFAHEAIISAFLDKIEAGELADERFVASMQICDEDDRTGAHWFLYPKIGEGSAEEIIDMVSKALTRTGEVSPTFNGRFINRRIGGPKLAVAPVRECYLRLRTRAFAAGFDIDGRSFEKISQ